MKWDSRRARGLGYVMCSFEVDRFAWPKTAMRMCPFEVDPFA